MPITQKDLEDAFSPNKAIFFLDVSLSQQKTDELRDITKYIAYVPTYAPNINDAKNILNSSSSLPYREQYAKGKKGKMQTFKDDVNQTVREVKNFGKNPPKNPRTATDTQNPFPALVDGVLLHFYIVRDADQYHTGDQVGIAQVSTAGASSGGKTKFLRLTLPIYRVAERLQSFFPKAKDEGTVEVFTSAAFVATRGGPPVRPPNENGAN